MGAEKSKSKKRNPTKKMHLSRHLLDKGVQGGKEGGALSIEGGGHRSLHGWILGVSFPAPTSRNC